MPRADPELVEQVESSMPFGREPVDLPPPQANVVAPVEESAANLLAEAQQPVGVDADQVQREPWRADRQGDVLMVLARGRQRRGAERKQGHGRGVERGDEQPHRLADTDLSGEVACDVHAEVGRSRAATAFRLTLIRRGRWYDGRRKRPLPYAMLMEPFD